MLTLEEWVAVQLSLKVAVWSTLWSLPPALLVGWVLSRTDFPGKGLFDGLVHLPLVLPSVVVGYLLLVALGTSGLVGQYLQQWFGISLVFTTAGATVAAAVVGFPLMVNAVRRAADGVDPGVETAARSLGAAPLDAFCTVTLPLMVPGIVSGVLISLAAALGEFGATITFAGDIEGATRTLPLAIYGAARLPDGGGSALRLTAISIVLALSALALAGVAERRIKIALGRI